jgi:hypothetical protein
MQRKLVTIMCVYTIREALINRNKLVAFGPHVYCGSDEESMALWVNIKILYEDFLLFIRITVNLLKLEPLRNKTVHVLQDLGYLFTEWLSTIW